MFLRSLSVKNVILGLFGGGYLLNQHILPHSLQVLLLIRVCWSLRNEALKA